MPGTRLFTQSGFEMKVGMLWFDNDSSQTFDWKVRRAAAYYQKKYGQFPSLCYVHPTMLESNPVESANGPYKTGQVEVRCVPWVLPNHFWIGNNGDED